MRPKHYFEQVEGAPAFNHIKLYFISNFLGNRNWQTFVVRLVRRRFWRENSVAWPRMRLIYTQCQDGNAAIMLAIGAHSRPRGRHLLQ
jgi:hypothetical protein